MEELSGRTVAELAALPRTPAEAERLERLARNAAGVFLDMIFRDAFFHADPHPGNMLILAGDRIGLLDCGMSFDDGTVFDKPLIALLRKYHFKATFNLNSGMSWVGERRKGEGQQ